uniref:Uncharacterized protein n=1 Tax=Mycena chlorophos TaxID=658473 RepID=A0ABQ0M6U8_MYCCL|nr:predicted protein [Mycena chlorophos]
MPKSNKDLSYSQEHVLQRALERYNLELTDDDYASLNQRVLRATQTQSESPEWEAETLLNDEHGEQIWGVVWGTQTLLCVWTISLARVTTLLPEGTTITRRKGGTTQKTKK